jgi:hypothetical protein
MTPAVRSETCGVLLPHGREPQRWGRAGRRRHMISITVTAEAYEAIKASRA